jgi:hypothetical protein
MIGTLHKAFDISGMINLLPASIFLMIFIVAA